MLKVSAVSCHNLAGKAAGFCLNLPERVVKNSYIAGLYRDKVFNPMVKLFDLTYTKFSKTGLGKSAAGLVKKFFRTTGMMGWL
ncbi:MAG: hypothetical protein LBK53_08455 [Heliobacteriaceae bacterium]|jgi:hypothetical protein|nr:hypothetical protein [Heliobacteriaceae bacterium]